MNTKVFAYRNLNRKGVVWSVKDTKTNLVIDRVHEAYFLDVELKVSEAGRKRVLDQKTKNVHAGIQGYRIDGVVQKVTWTKVTYNPYINDTFVDSLGNPVHKAKYAKLNSEGLWIAHVQDIAKINILNNELNLKDKTQAFLAKVA